MEPMQLPERSSGSRARACLVARFAVYAVIIAAGGLHLISRDTASGDAPPAPGKSVSGITTQQLPISLKVDEGRVVSVDLSWRAPCSTGGAINWSDGFTDAHKGDFERDGSSFKDEWEVTHLIWDGLEGRLHGSVQGHSADAVTRGSVEFRLEILDGDRVVGTCESGPIGYAVDLPS